MTGWLKVLLELGPLVVFFVVFTLFSPPSPTSDEIFAGAVFEEIASAPAADYVAAALRGHAEAISQAMHLDAELNALIIATVAFMASLFVSLLITYIVAREISKVAVFTAVIVLVTGALTIYLHNGVFVKMKPTIVYGFFAIMLFYGLSRRRSYLKDVFGQMLEITQRGWMKLARNWGFFFVFCAGLNEFIWRVYDTETWVLTKTFVYVPLIILFAIAQAPVMTAHALKDAKAGSAQPSA